MNALTALQLYVIAVELFFLGLEAVTQHPDWLEAPQSATGSIHSKAPGSQPQLRARFASVDQLLLQSPRAVENVQRVGRCDVDTETHRQIAHEAINGVSRDFEGLLGGVALRHRFLLRPVGEDAGGRRRAEKNEERRGR